MIDYFTFSKDDAMQYGVEGAVMLHHIRYWIAKNEANGTNYREDRYWTYNSSSAFAKLFPFWSSRKIARLLSKLEELGAITSSNFNEAGYDRTKWYTLSNALDKIDYSHLSKVTNGLTETVQPIPNNNQSTIHNTTNIVMPFEDERFKEAWNIWLDERKQKKIRKYTQRGEQGALHKLQKDSGDDVDLAIEMINNAICNGWQGIYPIKNGKRNNKTRQANINREEYSKYLDSL